MSQSASKFAAPVVALATLNLFQLESPAFAHACSIFLIGAVASTWVADRHRLSCMTLTSLSGLFFMFSPVNALLLLGIGTLLVFICGSQLNFGVKAGLLTLAAAALLEWRGISQPSSRAWILVPIVGAIFMLRTASYLREVHRRSEGFWSEAAAFFSLLPNVALLFFPLIDFGTFRDSAREPRDPRVVHEGWSWVFEGLLQLLLYRFLNDRFFLPFEHVTSYGQFFRYLPLMYLTYIRISGTFHIVTGLIGVYGVRLPRTHREYFFASSGLDLTRRINTYWKDFMVQNVYHPVYKLLRQYGKRAAAISGMILVFAASFVLHPYYYLWTRHIFVLSLKDVLFWSLCALWGAIELLVRRDRAGRARRRNDSPASHFMGVTFTFTYFCLLWAIWNCPNLGDLIAGVWFLQWKGFADFAWIAVFPGMGLLATAVKYAPARLKSAAGSIHFSAQVLASLLACLLLVPGVLSRLGPDSQLLLSKMRNPNYSPEFEYRRREHSYYEGFKTNGHRPKIDEDERPIAEQPYFESVPDFRRRKFRPNVTAIFMHQKFVTNRWGMNDDRDPALKKPAGTFRIALLSASNSIAYGVPTDASWPKQAEAWFKGHGVNSVRFLNFSDIGYSAWLAPYVYQRQVRRFHPDVCVYAGTARDLWLGGFNAQITLRKGLAIPQEYAPELLSILGLHSTDGILARHYPVQPSLATEYKLFHWGIKHFAQEAAADHVPVVFVLLPDLYKGRVEDHIGTHWDEYNMLKYARSRGFRTIDLSRVLDKYPLKKVTILDDLYHYNHFNSFGHSLLGQEFAKKFVTWLKEFGGPKWTASDHSQFQSGTDN